MTTQNHQRPSSSHPPFSPGVAPFINVLAGDKGSLRLSEVIATTKKG